MKLTISDGAKRPQEENGMIYVKGKADQQTVACILLSNGYEVSYVKNGGKTGNIVGVRYWTVAEE